MTTTINQRIAILIKELKMNNNSFAKSINKSSSTINYIVEGKTKPGYELLEGIVTTYPQVNAEWLMKGEGELMISAQTDQPDTYLQEHLEKLETNFTKLLEQLTVKDTQIQYKDSQIAGLQRVVDAFLLGKLDGVPFHEGRIVPLWQNQEDSLDNALKAVV